MICLRSHRLILGPQSYTSGFSLISCKIQKIDSSHFQDHTSSPYQFLTALWGLLKYLLSADLVICHLSTCFPSHSVYEWESELVLPALKCLSWVPMTSMHCHIYKETRWIFHSSGSKPLRLDELSSVWGRGQGGSVISQCNISVEKYKGDRESPVGKKNREARFWGSSHTSENSWAHPWLLRGKHNWPGSSRLPRPQPCSWAS